MRKVTGQLVIAFMMFSLQVSEEFASSLKYTEIEEIKACLVL